MTTLPEEEKSTIETATPEHASRWWLGLVVAVVLIGVVIYVLPLAITLAPRKMDAAWTIEDQNDLRNIVGVAISQFREMPLAADGRVDIYQILRDGELDARQIQDLCHSARADTGPSIAEIGAGDYANCPYQRHRGAVDLGSAEPVPLVWEREPRGGEWLVGYANGASLVVEESVMREWLRAHPEQE